MGTPCLRCVICQEVSSKSFHHDGFFIVQVSIKINDFVKTHYFYILNEAIDFSSKHFVSENTFDVGIAV